jgi:hypothetical protein
MNLFKKCFICFLLLCLLSCKPKIFSFTASRHIVTSMDSVHLEWKVRGKPELDFSQKRISYFSGDSVDLLLFKLTVRKGRQKPVSETLEVKLVPPLYKDYLAITVTGRNADTLVASGIKDSMYRDFNIESIASRNDRRMMVVHGGREIILSDSGSQVQTLKGLDYEGPWNLRSLLTPEEKQNPRLIPDRFIITVLIQPKNK